MLAKVLLQKVTHFTIFFFTFPFVIAAWIFLLPNIDLLPETHQD